MTRNRLEMAVGFLYRHCTDTVPTLVLTIVFAGAVHAGAWEEFHARCLMPMENIALSQPADMKPYQYFKNDGDTYSNYRFAGGDFILSVSDGRDGRARWCSLGVAVEGAEPSAEIANKFLDWSSQSETIARYEETADTDGALKLRSTNWREPKMDVTMLMLPSGPGIFLSAEETDLES